MGTIHVFPGRGHLRASSKLDGRRAPSSAKTSKLISGKPRSAAMRPNVNQCADGMPLTRQRLTVDGDIESAAATALVPPRESMTESAVTMEETLVCTMQTCQEFASRKTTFGTGYGVIEGMIDPRHVIAGRLEALRTELGIATEEKFATAIGLDKSTYSSIKNAKRSLSFETACRMKEKWGISLDWVFYGDIQQSAAQIMARIGRGPAVDPPSRPAKRKAS